MSPTASNATSSVSGFALRYWDHSPAFKAYLALGRVPKKCPPCRRGAQRATMWPGEIYCRMPGRGRYGLCGKRCASREDLTIHFKGPEGHAPLIALCPPCGRHDPKLEAFYVDIMKHENYEGKPEPVTGHGRAGTMGARDPFSSGPTQASNDTRSHADKSKQKSSKRKRQEAENSLDNVGPTSPDARRLPDTPAFRLTPRCQKRLIRTCRKGNAFLGGRSLAVRMPSELSRDRPIAADFQRIGGTPTPASTIDGPRLKMEATCPFGIQDGLAQPEMVRVTVVDLSQDDEPFEQEEAVQNMKAIATSQDISLAADTLRSIPVEQSKTSAGSSSVRMTPGLSHDDPIATPVNGAPTASAPTTPSSDMLAPVTPATNMDGQEPVTETGPSFRSQHGRAQFQTEQATAIVPTQDNNEGAQRLDVAVVNEPASSKDNPHAADPPSAIPPTERSKSLTEMETPVSQAKLATPRSRLYHTSAPEPDEEDLVLDQREGMIKNQILQNQLQLVQRQRQLNLLRKRKTAPK